MAAHRPIARACFIGGGTMGCYNALLAGIAGLDVTIYDPNDAALANVEVTQQAIGAHLIGTGFCTVADLSAGRNNIALSSDLDAAVAGAGLISESVTEQLAVKRDVHAKLEALLPPDVLITTNTSTLLVSDIESCLEHGDRFAALHSHLGSILFDIVPGPRTTAATMERLTQYVQRINCEPLVLKKEHPGYVFNALLGPVLLAAKVMHIGAIATIPAIDRAWVTTTDSPLGPFGLMDLFGLDVVADSWAKPLTDPVRQNWQQRVQALLKDQIGRGRLGIKTGAGFYDYPQDDAHPDSDIDLAESVEAQIMIGNLVQAAITLADIGVADRADIDRAWRVGLSVPMGPFDWLSTIGEQDFRDHYLPLLSRHELYDPDTQRNSAGAPR